MRAVFRLALLTLVLGLPALAAADEQRMSKKPAEQATSTPPAPWYKNVPPAEACWGDSSESDADLNDGSRITTEEILRILNPAQS